MNYFDMPKDQKTSERSKENSMLRYEAQKHNHPLRRKSKKLLNKNPSLKPAFENLLSKLADNPFEPWDGLFWQELLFPDFYSL